MRLWGVALVIGSAACNNILGVNRLTLVDGPQDSISGDASFDSNPDGLLPAFFDDFESGADSQWTVLSGAWSVQSGKYSQSSLVYGALTIAGSDWADLTAEARIVLSSGTDDLQRLAVRFVDIDNFCAAFFSKFYSAVGVEQVVGGVRAFSQVAFSPNLDQSYALRAVVTGDQVSVHVDGVQMTTWTLPAGGPASGRIGLGTSAANVMFDDVLVTTP